MFMTSTAHRLGATLLAAGGFAVCGVTEIIHSQRDAGMDVVGVAGYTVLAGLVVGLIGLSGLLLALRQHVDRPAAKRAGAIAAAGTAGLSVTCLTSIINGHDLDLFVVVAPLTNAAWLFGSIVLAIGLRRAANLPPAVSFALPLAWFCAIPIGTFGGGVLTAACLLVIGRALVAGGAPLVARVSMQG